MTPGFHSDLDEATYHADRGSLSQSGAKVLLESPALFRHQLDTPREPSDAMQLGTLVHTEVLGTGQRMAIIPPTGKTKVLQEAHAKAKADAATAGLIPVTQERAEQVWAMGSAVMKHPEASRLLSGATPEVSAYCPDPETGVMRRCRYDGLRDDLAIDLKTTQARTRNAFAKSAANFGYHQQHAWYLDVADDLGQPLRSLLFITVTSAEPYEVNVYELDEYSAERGRELNHRALRLYKQCMDSDDWSGSHTIQRLSLPRWAFYDDFEESA